MNASLAELRSRLRALQGCRAVVRWGNAICLVMLIAIGLLAAAFAADWSLRLSFGFRCLMIGGWFAGMAWAVHRFAWPMFSVCETLEDVALIVECRQHLDSDLIAALQFEFPEATTWGSPGLSAAVVESVAQRSPRLDVFRGFTWEQLPRRLTYVLIALLGVALAGAVAPRHVSAFWNRFWLGSARYPSRTEISDLKINGQSISLAARGRPPLKLAQGTFLTLEVACRGEVPESGSARLVNRSNSAESRFDLKPVASSVAGLFTAEHVLPSSDVELQMFLGDSWVDPVTIQVVPLPLVQADWKIVPPNYAALVADDDSPAAGESLAVLEGSELQLSVRGTNKRLARVTLRLDEQTIPLVSSGKSAASMWTLPAGSPLASVRQGWQFEIDAVDEDGLSLTPLLAGSIRLRADRPPHVTAVMVTKFVVPTATPRLVYGVVDDYGTAEVRLQIVVQKTNRETQSHSQLLKPHSADQPPRAVLRGEIRLDLAPYQLEKGDEVRVTVEAADNRGDLAPQIGVSEPLVLKVTDRAGILSSLQESDQQSVKQLDTIIQWELGIGGDQR